ncbi:MAG: hypothetical protein MI919_24890, partial [Holophagales bacterium]|nr:hypothetical protein [Holophagales bacterium]
KPTIATGYSGNLDFMDSDSSLLVDHRPAEALVPEGPFRRGSRWAEPCLEHASHLMRSVYEKQAWAAEIGARGRDKIHATLTPAVVAARVSSLLAPDAARKDLRPLRSLGPALAGR